MQAFVALPASVPHVKINCRTHLILIYAIVIPPQIMKAKLQASDFFN